MPPKKSNGPNAARGNGSRRGRRGRGAANTRAAKTLADNQFLLSVLSPFAGPPAHIPDDKTTPSGIVVSRYQFTSGFNALGGTSASHNFGLVLPPYPYYAVLNETSAGNGILTDVTGVSGQWVSPNSYTTNPASVPNFAALMGQDTQVAKLRCVGLGVRVIYEGTELNRSGKVIAGLGPVESLARTQSTALTQLSMLSTVTGACSNTLATIRSNLQRVTEARIGNAPFEARWLPSGIPTYQMAAATWQPTPMGQVGGVVSSASTTPIASMFNNVPGSCGVQSGQNALVILIEGDTTSSAQVVSNAYSFEIIWRWEVVPAQDSLVSYDLTASPSNPIKLSEAINVMATCPVGKIPAGRRGF